MPNIIFCSGERVYKPLSEKVSNILSQFTSNTLKAEALMFNGKKLQLAANLSDVPHLSDKHNIYFVQKAVIPECRLDEAELKKYLKRYDDLSDEERRLVQKFVTDPANFHKIVVENHELQNDNFLQVVSDYPLFIDAIYKDDFNKEKAHLFAIFKRGVDSIWTKRSQQFNPFQPSSSTAADAQPANGLYPSFLVPTPPVPITSQMLQQALNMVGGEQPSASRSNSQSRMEVDENKDQLRNTYAAQMMQMRDFGFTDDDENLRALQLCDGDVERALELVISMRENDS